MADEIQKLGIKLVSGGTDNHLMLLDFSSLGVTGLEVEKNLDKAGITVNKNTVPNETRSPKITSGIRVGTPSVTTRGMKEDDMRLIARLIAKIVFEGKTAIPEVRAEVKKLIAKFPLEY